MKRSKLSEEQIASALRQHEAGTPVEDVCRQLGVSHATFYNWKKKYAPMGVAVVKLALSSDVIGRAGHRKRDADVVAR